MSTPRMSGTNEFVFFSSSDTHVAASATTPLKIHFMKYQNNLLTTLTESPVSNAQVANGFGFLEAEGMGYIACSV